MQRIGDDGERLVDLGGGDGERRDEAKGLEDGGGEQQQAALAACPLQPRVKVGKRLSRRVNVNTFS